MRTPHWQDTLEEEVPQLWILMIEDGLHQECVVTLVDNHLQMTCKA